MLPRALRITVVVLALLVTAALLAAIVIWQTRQAAIADRIEVLVQELLVANDSTRIEIGRVSGNPLNSVTLHDASLLVRDGDGWKSFVNTKRATVKYRLSELSPRGVRFESIEFHRGKRGEYIWPTFGDGSPPDSQNAFSFEVGRLAVKSGVWRIDTAGEELLMEDVSLQGSFRSDKGGVSLSGFSLNAFVASFGRRVERLSGNLGFKHGIVDAESLEVLTAESELRVCGTFDTNLKGAIELSVSLERLSLPEARAVDLLAFLPEEGVIGGEVRLNGENGGPLRVESSLRGTYGVHAIESLEAVSMSAEGRWQNSFTVKSDGAMAEGTFDVGPGARQECSVDFMNLDPGSWSDVLGPVNVPQGSLSGRFTFSGKGLTSVEREGDAELTLYGGKYAGVSFVDGSAAGRFTGDGGLVLSDVEVTGAGYSLKGEGSMGSKGELDVSFDVWMKNLSDVAALEHVFDFEGNVNLRGRLSGRGDTLRIVDLVEVEGHIDGTSPSIGSGKVSGNVFGQLTPSLALEVGAGLGVGGPLELGGLTMDLAHVQGGLEIGGTIAKVDVPAEYGRVGVTLWGDILAFVTKDTLIALGATAAFCDEGVYVTMDHFGLDVDARTSELTWKNETPVQIGWRERVLHVEGLKLSSGESRIELTGDFEPAKKRVRGKLDVSSLDVGSIFGSVLPVAGSVDGRVIFERLDSVPDVTAAIEWSGAGFQEKRVDRVVLSATASGQELSIDKLEIEKAGGELRVSGEVFLPFDVGVFVDSLVSLGSVPSGVRADLKVSANDLKLGEFSTWHPSLASVGGNIDAEARITGLLEDPRVNLSLDARDLRLQEYRLAQLSAEAIVTEGICAVSSVELVEHDARGEIKGFFPLALDIGGGRLSFPDAPLRLSVKLSESDFSVAALFIKQLASCSGITRGEAQFGGTLKNFTLRGGFELKDATLRLAGREEVLEDVDAQVTLSEKAIELVRCTGRLGNGKIEGTGRVYLSGDEKGHYDFKIKGKKVTMGDPEDVAVMGDCELRISSMEIKERGTYAQITGRVDVRQGIIAREFQASTGPQPEQRWLCNIEIEIPNNLWLKNTNAEIELAGSLTARKDISGLVLLGSLRILRGKYYVFGNEFRISSGTLEFKNVDAIDPEMNIEAETRASGRRVFLALTGKLSEPNIRLSSEDANLSQTEIVRLLTVGRYVRTEHGEGAEGGIMPSVTGSVGNYFLKQVERTLARDLRWVDSIEFGSGEEGSGSFSELRLGLGKYITPELYLRYSQGLTKTSERDVAVEYRLSELLFLRGEVVRRDRLRGAERDEYNLDLKLKYEY
jgi:hypothetical protein